MSPLRSERGAVMITSIFMVCFLVAMLYVVIGLGRTLVLREGMQDAADAAAYSSAIFNARGMNLIVFINLVMSALVAVLVALRIAQTLLLMAAAILAGLAWASMGATAPLAAQLSSQGIQMGERYKDAKDVIEPLLKGLHTTQEAVSVVVPWVAMTSGMGEAAIHHPPAQGAFALPGSTSLPVESDEFSVLCGRATELAAHIALMPVSHLGKDVLKPLENAAQELGEVTSKFLCGDGSGSPPTHTINVKQRLPRHPKEEECKFDPESSACDAMNAEMEAAMPNTKIWGKCTKDCSYWGPYETTARAARRVCESLSFHRLHSYQWQERTVFATFVFNGNQWVEDFRTIEERFYRETDRPPCGYNGIINEEVWNPDSGPVGADEPDAVCAEEIQDFPHSPVVGQKYKTSFQEVARIFACVVDIPKTYDAANKDDAFGGEDSEEKSPHRVEEDIDLGDEAFQIRAIAFGAKPGPGEGATKGVHLALHGEPTQPSLSEDFTELASHLGRFSVAQSEFYFDHQGGVHRDEWMWNMNWTARLKHFRLPSEEEEQEQRDRQEKNSAAIEDRVATFGGLTPGSGSEDSCRSQGGTGCEGTSRSLSLFDSLVRH